MTIQSCVRCGQLLLPELVRELGDGRRCPFCNADLKVDASRGRPPATAPRAVPQTAAPAARAQAQVAVPPQPTARRPPPAAPIARPAASPAAPTLLGMSEARSQTAAAAAVVRAARTAEPDTAPTPAVALVRTPEPDTAPNPLRDPAPLLASAPSSPPWLAALRKRPWLAAPAVLAAIVTIGLAVGRRPSATRRESAAPGPSVVPLSPAPPASVAPDSRIRVAAADHPVAARDAALPTGGSPKATGHAKAGARAHAVRRTHHHKRRAARSSRSKHTRVVALESAAAPKAAGDERSARDSYERGNQRLLTGDTAGAISAYEEAVRSAPSSPSGYRGLGLAYEKEGKSTEAVRAFRHYLKLAPSSGDRDLVARRLRHLLRPGGDPDK